MHSYVLTFTGYVFSYFHIYIFFLILQFVPTCRHFTMYTFTYPYENVVMCNFSVKFTTVVSVSICNRVFSHSSTRKPVLIRGQKRDQNLLLIQN